MKSIPHFLTLVCALLMASTSGCIDLDIDLQFLTFDNPSVAPEEAAAQAELFGSYHVTDVSGAGAPADFGFAHIGLAGAGFPNGFLRYVGVSVDPQGGMSVDDSGQPLFASKVGDCYILNCPLEKVQGEGAAKQGGKGKPEKVEEELSFEEDLSFDEEDQEIRVTKWTPENYEGYDLMVLKPTENGFAMYMLDKSFIKSEITAGRLDGQFMTEKQNKENEKNRKAAERESRVFKDEKVPFRVHAKPEELRAFFEKNHDKLIDKPILDFKRVK